MPLAEDTHRRPKPSLDLATATASTGELFESWQRRHDPRARDLLVARFLPLARKLARRYHGAHEPLDDLVQVASLGLVKAIDRYDPERGIGFAAFAVPTIVGELKRYFRDLGWSVHVPRGAKERAIRVEQARRRLTADTGHSPSFNELAEYTELTIDDVLEAAETSAAHHALSLDTPHADGEGEVATLDDTLGEVDEHFELVEAGTTIAEAARQLSARERRVLALRFVADQTQTQIAAEIGVSQMQVSRILRRSVERLTEIVEAD